MRINHHFLGHRARRFVSKKPTYESVCHRSWEICPATITTMPPALYLEDELSHVTGTNENDPMWRQLEMINGGPTNHTATTAYAFRGAKIVDGHLYVGPLRMALVPRAERVFRRPPLLEHMGKVALASSRVGNGYFGHWLLDELARFLAVREIAPPVRNDWPLSEHQKAYARFFQIDSQTVSAAHFEELIVVEDAGQNPYKQERYQQCRDRVKSHFPANSSRGAMLIRGASGNPRICENEHQVAELLEKEGFVVLDPMKSTVDEILAATSGAPILVGTDGSHLTHGLYSIADNGWVVSLQPPFRFSHTVKNYTDCMGLRYAFTVGNHSPKGFVVDIDRMMRTIDLVEKAAS